MGLNVVFSRPLRRILDTCPPGNFRKLSERKFSKIHKKWKDENDDVVRAYVEGGRKDGKKKNFCIFWRKKNFVIFMAVLAGLGDTWRL